MYIPNFMVNQKRKGWPGLSIQISCAGCRINSKTRRICEVSLDFHDSGSAAVMTGEGKRHGPGRRERPATPPRGGVAEDRKDGGDTKGLRDW